MFRLQSEQVDANPNSFGFQYGSLEYQNLQCENSVHVNRKHYVTQNDQGGTMHYTLKVYRLRTHWLKHYLLNSYLLLKSSPFFALGPSRCYVEVESRLSRG